MQTKPGKDGGPTRVKLTKGERDCLAWGLLLVDQIATARPEWKDLTVHEIMTKILEETQ